MGEDHVSTPSTEAAPRGGPALPASSVRHSTSGRPSLLLRYWRAVLKHDAIAQLGSPAEPLEEPDGPFSPDLLQPSSGGRSYFEISTSTDQAPELADLFVGNTGHLLVRPLQHAHRPLFERWLRARYAEQRTGSRGTTGDAAGTIAVGFPVLRYRQRGRTLLGALLQLPVVPTWCDAGGDPWPIPAPERRSGISLESGPASLRLQSFDTASLGQPFLLNENLLQRVLGHDPEAIAELLGWIADSPELTPEQMLVGVTAYLHGQGMEALEVAATEPTALLGGLASALRAALPRGTGAGLEAAAIVCETDWGVPTAQLQRELGEILRRREGDLSAPLTRYLLGDGDAPARSTRYGGIGTTPLTPEQTRAAERSLAAPLVVVEGPPGTGKTELILSLAADALVRGVAEGVYDDRRTTPSLLMVASTNNQAVDAVMDPLMEAAEIPFCIRMGNRHVLSTRTEATLGRVLSWLEDADPASARVQLADSLERFQSILESLKGPLSESSLAAQGVERQEYARECLPALEAELKATPSPMGASTEVQSRLGVHREALQIAGTIYDTLDELYERMETFAPFHPETADSIWRRELQPDLSSFGALLEGDAESWTTLASLGPPGARGANTRAEWLDGIYHQQGVAAATLDEMRARQEDLLQASEANAERAILLARKNALQEHATEVPEVGPPLSEPERKRLTLAQHALFREALTVRDAWARSRATRLIPLVRRWRSAAQGRSWWQGHLEDEGERTLFSALFPVAGCTLLSMGTSWPLLPDLFDQLVVDEAGQCLPSYPITALYRSRRALFLGDTHQLEPVNSLSAHEEAGILEEVNALPAPHWLEAARSHRDAPSSAQALAETSASQVLHLRDHFRCQEEIISISNRLCGYALTIQTPRRTLANRTSALPTPVIFIPTGSDQERWCGSQRNPEEALRTAEFVEGLLKDGVEPASIGVISPYRAQTVLLESHLRQRGIPIEDWEMGQARAGGGARGRLQGVLLGTIHRIQGGERDVVVLSTVATTERSLRWLNRRPNLLNVAVSRARLHLVILGSPEALREGPYTKELVPADWP